MIAVTINGEARDLGVATTVGALVDELDIGPRGVAVAVNSEVVPRSAWGATTLASGDQVEILQAVKGGC